ncbi:NAD-dependent epimerase/dehydratase family protein [Planctomycetota bacterium]
MSPVGVRGTLSLMRILVTGAAGFIGYHVAQALLARGDEVLGVDSLNAYYDPNLKLARLERLRTHRGFSFLHLDVAEGGPLADAWDSFSPERVLHLAAQAGVRHSIEAPLEYVTANLVGFQNVVELVRTRQPQTFVYASSSSVYGGTRDMPFTEAQPVSSPISLYAATKISNELVAKSYAHLFDMPSTGLRYFTVYGPFGRPDMAIFKFAVAMLEGRPIHVYNRGEMARDFTYVSDIVSGTLSALDRPLVGRVLNLGRGSPVHLMDTIRLLEQRLGRKASLELMPMQPGDVKETFADISLARDELGYEPRVDLETGVDLFVSWLLEFRGA